MKSMTHQLKKVIDEIVSQLITRYKPEKIVLFGSAAEGITRSDSDIDIVVVKNTPQRFYDRLSTVRSLIHADTPLDILVYTPQEYETLARESWFVGEEIVKKGKTVYAV